MSITYLRSLQNGHFLPLVGGEIPEAGEVVQDDGEQGLSVVVGLLVTKVPPNFSSRTLATSDG